MISKLDLMLYAKRNEEKCWFRIENDNVIKKENGEIVSKLDTMVQYLRDKLHCNFVAVYEEHATLSVILRCMDCGTVIFSRDDESYDPNLCCPTCGGYKTHFDYWTAEDIKSDPQKQETIKFYERLQKDAIEAEKRRKRRKGKYDWEIGKCTIRGKKHDICFELECNNLFLTKLKGLHLNIVCLDKDGIRKKKYTIPLSWSYFRRKLRKKARKTNVG